MSFIYVMYGVYDQHKVYGRSSYFINTVHSAFCIEYILFLLGWALGNIVEKPSKAHIVQGSSCIREGKVYPTYSYRYLFTQTTNTYYKTFFLTVVLYELVQSNRSTPCTYRHLSVTIKGREHNPPPCSRHLGQIV